MIAEGSKKHAPRRTARHLGIGTATVEIPPVELLVQDEHGNLGHRRQIDEPGGRKSRMTEQINTTLRDFDFVPTLARYEIHASMTLLDREHGHWPKEMRRRGAYVVSLGMYANGPALI